MKKVWRFIRRWWWAFLAGAAAILGAIATILLRPKPPAPSTDPNAPQKPTFSEVATREAERVRLEGEIEKARVITRADAERDRIAEIEAKGDDDPAEARAELAEYIRNNL